ncbi:hypothetical protein RMATCC62417_17346 [Rhizopus microsporus]|nr:hypothetical protein RMATCC62417_17346 [Rhizopus microsporus]
MPTSDKKWKYSSTEDIPLAETVTNRNDGNIHDRSSYPYEDINENKRSFFVLLKSLFLVFVSIFFATAILLVLLNADGKPLDYTLVKMKITSLISLLLNLYVIFTGSGIAMAISEYKWIKLRNGAPLTVADIYDGCTRGMGGFLTAIKGAFIDIVLIFALIFNLGLLVLSPVSQELIVPVSLKRNLTSIVDSHLYYNDPFYVNDRTNLSSLPIPPTLNGLTYDNYLIPMSFANVARHAPFNGAYTCPSYADYCVFRNKSFVSTSLDCTPVTDQEPIVNQSNYKELTTPARYYTEIEQNRTLVHVPTFFYAGEMLNRTFHDLQSYKPPLAPGGFIASGFLYSDYDPQYRPYVGNQTFVLAYSKTRCCSALTEIGDISYARCTFRSSLNTTDWKTSNGTLIKHGQETSVPITFDFDHVLGNNTALFQATKDADNSTRSIGVMINAYLMQQALLKEFISPQYRPLIQYLRIWNMAYPATITIFDYLKPAMQMYDLNYAIAPYVTGSYFTQTTTEGLIFATDPPVYSTNKTYCYVLFALMFLPVVWWLVVWSIGIKHSNGRGNSQISLMTMEMTPLASQSLRNISNMSSSEAFKRAKSIRVRIGNHATENKERLVLKLEDEHGISH